jgi:hypothetical protein
MNKNNSDNFLTWEQLRKEIVSEMTKEEKSALSFLELKVEKQTEELKKELKKRKEENNE